MSITKAVADTITNAEARALATTGSAGLNVVPISMARVTKDTIWLFDFFMDKTVANIKTDNRVSLTAWTGLSGVQVRATARYVSEGSEFEEAVAYVQRENPERVTKGLLILTPSEIYDVSPGGVFSTDDLEVS
jgi:predicted pyridoxine 5'-phosphate oxidase superfamily flavin-nucleotide-binding protein